MKSCRSLFGWLLVCCFIPSFSQGGLIVLNTGLSASGDPLPGGAEDPRYIISFSNDPATVTNVAAKIVQSDFPGVWIANSATSKWIAPNANQGPNAGGETGAVTIFRTTFDLSGYDLATVRAEGRYAVDNAGDVQLNGNSVSLNADGFSVWTPLIITNGFVQGVNILDFSVVGLGVPARVDTTALKVELTVYGCSATAVPGILKHPSSQRIFINKSHTLEVVADCTTAYTFQWRKAGVEIPGAKDRTYTLTNIKLSDAGEYDVVVSSPAGSTLSKPATLRIGVAGLFNTGVDSLDRVLPAGAADLHYYLSASADPNTPPGDSRVVNNAYPVGNPWLANTTVSKWVGPKADQDNSTGMLGGSAEGNYTYTLKFDTTGLDLSLLRISGRFASDNNSSVTVNGQAVSSTADFINFREFNLGPELLVGENTVSILVFNGPGAGPTALRMEWFDRILPATYFNPPTLTLVRMNEDGTPRLRLTGNIGQVYQIQSRYSFSDPLDRWTFSFDQRLEEAEYEFDQPDAVLPTQKFFRALLIPE